DAVDQASQSVKRQLIVPLRMGQRDQEWILEREIALLQHGEHAAQTGQCGQLGSALATIVANVVDQPRKRVYRAHRVSLLSRQQADPVVEVGRLLPGDSLGV